MPRPAGVIFSGGPKSVHVEGAPSLDPKIYELDIPILATEYAPGGFQALAPWITLQATDFLRATLVPRFVRGADELAPPLST